MPTSSASRRTSSPPTVQHFVIRGGRVRGVRATTIEKELDITGGDLVDQVLQRTYGDAAPVDIPRQVLVPALPDDSDELEQWLRDKRERPVTIQVAQRGRKAELMKTAKLNAQQALILHKTRRTSDYVARTQALTDLQEALGLAEAPLRIECYDVSHLGGTNVVASMVVFEDGLPRKDQYRSFGVPETTDDTDSLYQVLTRRLAYVDRGDAEDAAEAAPKPSHRWSIPTPRSSPPASGRGSHIVRSCSSSTAASRRCEAAARALADAGHDEIALCGIAKRLEEVWLPGEDYPVILPRTSEALYLLQRLRDEAHRFAITHQRRRRRRDIQSVLAEVPGLGDARIKALLRHFGSVAALKKATPDEITELPGVGPKLAAAIHAHLANG